MREEVIGSARLILGDCRDVLPTLSGVDAVVTDPPYFLPAVHYNTRKLFPRSLTDLGILEHYFAGVFGEISACLTSAGVCYAFCDGQSYPAFYATAYRNFRKLRPLVWDKVTAFNGYSWRHQHELILFCEKDDAESTPTGDGDIIRHAAVRVDDREHPAEKPPALLQRLISKSVRAGGTICDPFLGSGATAVAATFAGVACIGIEKEPAYFDVACRRIEAAQRQADLFVPQPEATRAVQEALL
jgi:site-specific DNA-methyltransferase (adenine-specific)